MVRSSLCGGGCSVYGFIQKISASLSLSLSLSLSFVPFLSVSSLSSSSLSLFCSLLSVLSIHAVRTCEIVGLEKTQDLRKRKEKDDSSERNARGGEDMDKGKKECNWSSWRGQVVDLLHWRDLKQSGLVFGSVLLLLFSLTQFSVVSVIAYLALAVLSATISFRVYKSVLQAVQKTDEGHPFKAYLEVEIALSGDQIMKYVDKTQLYINSTMKELRRLFLVQDLIDSIKFAVLMWLLTYVGALFNGLTLLILVVVSMFSVPVVYEKYQTQIDQYLGLVRTQVNSIMGKIREKVPGAKKKE
ncbi:reticulon-1-A-like isoform X4 [Carassius auratus]|uniref:Reticulon n=1 Tax=Carassius auratus TaxID=7957 RepID=A0A6P6QL23_CARAU|nr:reticulon-1-A-like isoform X4 [Carassius auratus]